MSRKPTMNGPEKSDGLVVPTKSPNDARLLVEEAAEGRSSAKGNTGGQNAPRTQSRVGAPNALDRVREAVPRTASTIEPEAGAECGNPARSDLCGGRSEP